MFTAVKLLEGFYAYIAYERQYLAWRSNPQNAGWGELAERVLGGLSDALHLATHSVAVHRGASG
ncbi:hypothetical protein OAL97_01180 [Paracoccaceae bacterium]|nr:hypothetical protein [Paracoccaceae bacterium]